MKYIKIGSSSLKASQMALGCMRMAAKSVDEASQIITAAVDAGVTLFDHADIYGGGESEVRFAAALKQAGLKRDDLILQSKVGIRKGFFDFSKEHIVNSVDQILERLDTEYLDTLLLHRPDALIEPEEVAEAFETLYMSGKVRYFGVSNQSPGQIALLQRYLKRPLIANQLQFGPAHTRMIDTGLNVNMAEGADYDNGVLDYCRLNDITIQPWSPFQVTLSEGLFMNHPDYAEMTAVIQALADSYSVSFEAIVLAWINRHPADMQTIVGSMNPERIQAIAEAFQVSLTREEWYRIYTSGGRKLP